MYMHPQRSTKMYKAHINGLKEIKQFNQSKGH